MKLQQMLANISGGAIQIEVGMVGQVDGRQRIAVRQHLDAHPIVVTQVIADADIQGTWEALIAIGGVQGEADMLRTELLNLPAALVEAVEPAVQQVDALAGHQLAVATRVGQVGVGDAVGIASHHGAQIGLLLAVLFGAATAEQHLPASLPGDRHPAG